MRLAWDTLTGYNTRLSSMIDVKGGFICPASQAWLDNALPPISQLWCTGKDIGGNHSTQQTRDRLIDLGIFHDWERAACHLFSTVACCLIRTNTNLNMHLTYSSTVLHIYSTKLYVYTPLIL